MAVSVYGGQPRIQLDEDLAKRDFIPGSLNPTGTIINVDDFSRGTCGWSIIDGETMQISQGQGLDFGDMAEGVFSPWSIMTHTNDSSGSVARLAKRLTIQNVGKVGWEAWYCWKSSAEANVRDVQFTFDIQSPCSMANPYLCWPGVRYYNHESGSFQYKWQYQSGPRSNRGWTDIPLGFQRINWNMWGRYNWNRIKLVIDLLERKYVRLESNDLVWDLSNIPFECEKADADLFGLFNPIFSITADANTRSFIWMNLAVYTINEP